MGMARDGQARSCRALAGDCLSAGRGHWLSGLFDLVSRQLCATASKHAGSTSLATWSRTSLRPDHMRTDGCDACQGSRKWFAQAGPLDDSADATHYVCRLGRGDIAGMVGRQPSIFRRSSATQHLGLGTTTRLGAVFVVACPGRGTTHFRIQLCPTCIGVNLEQCSQPRRSHRRYDRGLFSERLVRIGRSTGPSVALTAITLVAGCVTSITRSGARPSSGTVQSRISDEIPNTAM
jgi:hypothetical protein